MGMQVKERERFVDPDIKGLFSFVQRGNERSGEITALLRLNGRQSMPTREQIEHAEEGTQRDENRMLSAYAAKVGYENFGVIIADADRAETDEELGLHFNAAVHYSKAAESAYRAGSPDWAMDLILRANKNYEQWKGLSLEDPIGLSQVIETSMKRIIG